MQACTNTSVQRKIKIAPSLLSADFSRLEEDIIRVQQAGADLLHIDVMDGHFVPNITIGPLVVKCIRRVTKLTLESHLMIDQPLKYADEFVCAGSDMLTVHIERINDRDFEKLHARLKKQGVSLGISLNPATPLKCIERTIKTADFILIMSVNPGFGGQEFIPSSLNKIRNLRGKFAGDIAVDGGINAFNAGNIIEAGANILVSGSYIFRAKNAKIAIERLRNSNKRQ